MAHVESILEHVMTYPELRSAVQITKLANMWEEMKVFVKNWEGSIPQSVAMAAVKSSYNALHLWLLTAYEISWDFI